MKGKGKNGIAEMERIKNKVSTNQFIGNLNNSQFKLLNPKLSFKNGKKA